MRKSKGQTIDSFYTNKSELAKKIKNTNKSNKLSKKNKKNNKQKNSDIINLDNEIIIGMTLKEQKKKTKKSTNKNSKTTKENVHTTKKSKKTSKLKTNVNKNKEKTKKRSIKFKIIKYLILIIVLIILIILFLLSSLFNITEILVEDNKKITSQEIVNLSGLVKNENMFKTSNRKIREGVKQNPYIEDVTIIRHLPGQIKLKVIERNPTYMLKFANGYAYINNQGYILEISEKDLEIPEITGLETTSEEIEPGNRLRVEDLKKLENIINIMEIANNTTIASKITEIDVSNSNNYKIVIASEGKTIQFGDLSNINIKILKIEYILEKEKGREGEIYFQGTEKTVFREKV